MALPRRGHKPKKGKEKEKNRERKKPEMVKNSVHGVTGGGDSMPKGQSTTVEVKRENHQEEENEANIGSHQEEENEANIGSHTLTLTDPKLLDCIACLKPLTIPVFQCGNGHLACSACSGKHRDTCPSCEHSLSCYKTKAIENLLGSTKITCQNRKYGCKAVLKYSEKPEHEKKCGFVPISCPLPNCTFKFISSSKNLCSHLSSEHPGSLVTFFQYNSPFSISMENGVQCHFLQEEDEGSLFVINRSAQLQGNDVKFSCAVLWSSEEYFIYDLSANSKGSSIRVSSLMQSIQSQVNDLPSKGSLLVPSGFLGSSGQLKLLLCIRPANRLFHTY